MRLMVHLPTRSRPQRALGTIENYRRLASGRHHIAYSFSIDVDDPTMNNPAMLGKLRSVGRVHIGANKSKVEACNAGIERDFDILLLASDDMVPISRGWDETVAQAMDEHFPNFDGGLWFSDGRTADKLCTYPIMGVNWYKKFGYVYHPDYLSLSCDAEATELWTQMRRLPYINRVLFRHDHHSFPGLQRHRDALYTRNDNLGQRDAQVYFGRRETKLPLGHRPEGAIQFGYGQAPVRFSILIPTLKSRDHFLRRLLAQLNDEINGNDLIQEVEIVIDRDNGQLPVGTKRQRLLERAVGDYIAFIDDDDLVCKDYCRQIIAILRRESPDCIGLVGEYTVDGRDPQKFIHSINNHKPGWFTENGVHYRNPNHLNPVRRVDALRAGFRDMPSGEDHDYSMRLEANGMTKGKHEVMLPGITYHYLCRRDKGHNGFVARPPARARR